MSENLNTIVDIEGWPYTISREGVVRHMRTGRILKHKISGRGYPVVELWRGNGKRPGERRSFAVHNLLADAFLGPRPPGHEVNHKDGNKLNFTLTNFEWVTRSQNLKHAVATGLRVPNTTAGQQALARKYGREQWQIA